MRDARTRGFTLVELMTALALSGILIALVVGALVGLARERSVREVVSAAQEEGRTGFSILAREVRSAALGAPTGILWIQDASGNRASRPAVQIYDDVAGGGLVPVKPGTDVLLVVQALPSPRAAARGDHFSSTAALTLTDVTGFAVGTPVVFGEYADAGFARVTGVDADDKQLTLSSTVNLYPAAGGKLPSGSLVRPARARLYYVNTADELVRMDLRGPVPPATTADLGAPDVLARSFENLQLDCVTDGGGAGLVACGGGVASPDPLAADATAALGASTARITVADAPLLRLVRVSAVVHGARPFVDARGDGAIALDGAALTPAGASTTSRWVRRAYRLELAVRNTSLEAL